MILEAIQSCVGEFPQVEMGSMAERPEPLREIEVCSSPDPCSWGKKYYGMVELVLGLCGRSA
eukprot:7788876-Prorocentrum_lima.AAC.1